MADDTQFLNDYFNAYTAGLGGGGGVPADWAPPAASVTVNPNAPEAAADIAPGDAYAMDTTAAPAAGGGFGGILSGLGGLFTGGGGAAAPGRADAPGMNQSMIGLGLGLLAGNPFNRWGPALQGYQRGAAADVARAQQAEQALYHQRHLDLQRELAYRPTVHFGEDEAGYPFAAMWDPRLRRVTQLPMDTAEKLGGQPGVGRTIVDPWGRTQQLGPNDNVKLILRKNAEIRSDIISGKETSQEAMARIDASRMEQANKNLLKGDLDKTGASYWGIGTAVGGALGPAGEKALGAVSSAKRNEYEIEKGAFLNAVASRYPRQNRSDLERTYFPQPGASNAEILAAREARKQAVKDMQAGAAPAYRPPPPVPGVQRQRTIDRAAAKAKGYSDAEIDAYERGQ